MNQNWGNMRIKFTLSSKENILLDYKYNLYMRALIYKLLPDKLAKELHDVGFRYEKRSFKLFTFSRIFGRKIPPPHDSKKPLCFRGEIQFYLSSPVSSILEEFSLSSLKSESFELGGNKITLQAIEVMKKPEIGSSLTVRMLSPMTIRSTLTAGDGKKKSYYYNPREKEFSELIKKNLLKKYSLVYKEWTEGDFEVVPLRNCKERIIRGDGDFIIKAWDGIYKLKGTPKLIELSYDTGLGEKNSQGFGMWEVMK